MIRDATLLLKINSLHLKETLISIIYYDNLAVATVYILIVATITLGDYLAETCYHGSFLCRGTKRARASRHSEERGGRAHARWECLRGARAARDFTTQLST